MNLPFLSSKEAKQFTKELFLCSMRGWNARREKYSPSENMLVFHHGRQWSFQQEYADGFKNRLSELKLGSVRCHVDSRRLVAHDCTAISEFLLQTINEYEQQLFAEMRTEAQAVATANNTLLETGGSDSLAEQFLRLIERTDMSVDADGKVCRPSLHGPAELFEQLQREIELRGDEFREKIERARDKKEEEALLREAERLAKYEEE